MGVVGRELSEELALKSSELRLSDASLRPLLMELLSSQLQERTQRLAAETEAKARYDFFTLMKEGPYSSIEPGPKEKAWALVLTARNSQSVKLLSGKRFTF